MWVYINGNIEADEVYYNDFNPFMTNVFACCAQYEKFMTFLERVDAQDKDIFNRYKEEVLSVLNSGERIHMPDFNLGAMYMYIVTQTFSGIMSEKAKMIDLKGKYKPKYYSFMNRLENPKIQKKLEKIQVSNASYESFMPYVDDENTWFYLDPPYYGTEDLYAFHNFTKEDHKNLASILNICKGNWTLSYYDFPEMREWYPKDKYEWQLKEYKKASMASKDKKQSIGTEVLVIKREDDLQFFGM